METKKVFCEICGTEIDVQMCLSTLELIDLACELYRSITMLGGDTHDKYLEIREELESRLSQPSSKEPTDLTKICPLPNECVYPNCKCEQIKGKAGDPRVLVNGNTIMLDFRIITENDYQILRKKKIEEYAKRT